MKKIVSKAKYYYVLCFDKDGEIYKGRRSYAVPIDTPFTAVVKREDFTEEVVERYVSSISKCKLFSLTMNGVKTIDPYIIIYLDSKDRFVMSLARIGNFDYAFTVSKNTKKEMIYDIDTRTMFHLKGKEEFNELWGKVDEDVMISSYGRVKVNGALIKQDRRRVDYTISGKRTKMMIADMVHKYYNRKEGRGRTRHEPLNFYYRNIIKSKEE